VEPGRICMFGPITIEGADSVDERYILEQIRVIPGQRFDPRAISDTQRNLFSLSTFSSVQVVADVDAEGQVLPVTVRVTETTFRELRVGPGFAIKTNGGGSEVRGTARFEHNNFLGRLIRTEAEVQGGYRVFTNDLVSEVTEDAQDIVSDATGAIDGGPFVSTDLGLVYPHIFGLDRWAHTPTVSFERLFDEDQKSWKVEVAPTFRYQVTPNLSLSPGYRWKYYVIDELDPGVALRIDQQPYHIHRLELSTVWDHRKPLLRPQRGHFVDLYLATAGGFMPGETFGEARLDVRKYVTLTGRDRFTDFRPVLAGRVVGGAMLPYGDTQPGEVPYSERYFLGGSTTVRGFGERQLGPRTCRVYDITYDDKGQEIRTPVEGSDCTSVAQRSDQAFDADALGGEVMLYTNLELRLPFWSWGDLVVYQDTGWTWLDMDNLDLRQLQPGVGAGLRVASPAGPIRLDWGVRILDTATYVNDRRYANIYFALQEAF
jgi:outer membrane protein assembly factor BamA